MADKNEVDFLSWTDKVIQNLGQQEELVPSAFTLSEAVAHGHAEVTGRGPVDIVTPAEQWAYAVTFPYRLDAKNVESGRGPLVLKIDATVERGRVGIGCLTPDLMSYVTVEVERTSEDADTIFDLVLEPVAGNSCGWLVVRNAAHDGKPSRMVVRSIRTFQAEKLKSPDLVEGELPSIVNSLCPLCTNTDITLNGPALRAYEAQRFRILLTHTSRDWDLERCTKEYLARRYSDPKRLSTVPRFEDLSPHSNHQFYSGGLTLLELAVDDRSAHVSALRCIDSRYKIQHACFAGRKLVLCFEDFLAVIPDIDDPAAEIDLRPGSYWRIDDHWFGGLHTVFPVNDNACIVSSSAADAVLWVDLTTRTVFRRWRLPAAFYGMNYELTPDMSVVDHYIHNDIQLAHLNCAYPDGKGGCFVSTLIQGDVGHVNERGDYTLLARGYIGCHGVRLAHDGQHIYFTDSCNGRLMGMKPGSDPVELGSVESLWLHDVEQLDSGLHWFCLGDKNEGRLVDINSGGELGRFAFDSRGVNVQFVSSMRCQNER